MSDKKISQLTSLAQGDIATTTDVLAIVDTSATETKKATPAAIVGAAAAAGLTNVDINSGAIDGTTIGANSAAAGTFTNLTVNDNSTLGSSNSDVVTFHARVASEITPSTDDTYDLGRVGHEWRDLFIDGTANIDSLVADTADINGGTIDGATIATSDITVGSGKTLNVSAGTLTLADNQISGDKVEGGTINAITINTLTSTAVNATTVDATNVEVTNVKAKDGTAAFTIADSTGKVTVSTELAVDNINVSGNAITSTNTNGDIDLTPNGTGEVNITKVDIDSGAIDGTAIGANSASTGSFTTLGATTGNITTVNATTVDTTNIEVTNVKAKDGTAAASIADSTGVISVTSNPVLSGGTANGVLYLNASKVATSGSALTFDGTNLGVGTTSPTGRFEAATSTNVVSSIRTTGAGSTASPYTIKLSFTGVDAAGTGPLEKAYIQAIDQTQNVLDSYLSFGTRTGNTLAERARITSGGNLVVGRTDDTDDRISAYNGSSANYLMLLRNDAATQNFARFQYSGTTIGTITGNTTNTAYNTSSDRRLKENISASDDAGSIIDSIEVVKHDWKVGGHTRYGVIAQDLYEVAPEAVSIGDPDDAEELKQPWGVDYSKLVPMLIKEVQSLRKRVAELEPK